MLNIITTERKYLPLWWQLLCVFATVVGAATATTATATATATATSATGAGAATATASDGVAQTESNHPRHLHRGSRRLSELNPSNPNYFNLLRQEATEWQGPPDVNSTSYVFKVAVPYSTEVYRLAELKSFIPFSTSGEEPYLPIGEGMTALLALYHFNNVMKSPILSEEDVSGCKDLKLTMSLYDSMFDAIQTTRLITGILNNRKTLQNKLPAGVVGAYRSAASMPLAILTGSNHIPQVSPASAANDFDDKSQYPLFGRSIPAVNAYADASVDFFRSIGTTHVAVIYVTETLGASLQKAFQDAASKVGIRTTSVPISYYVESGSDEIIQALNVVKESKFRHVYVIVFVDQLPIVMEEAANQSVVGPDYFYLCPVVGITEYNTMSIDASNTALINALSSVGILGSIEGMDDTRVFAELNPQTQMWYVYHNFMLSWMDALQDPEFVQYARDSLPESLNLVPGYNATQDFDKTGSNTMLLYDAVTSLALAMCKAPSEFFTGEEVYAEFLKSDFVGVSGPVQYDNVTGSRLYESKYWGLWCARFNSTLPDGNASFSVTPGYQLVGKDWFPIPNSPFIYASGSSVPPDSLPPVQIDYNYIGTVGRAIGYTLMSITMLSAILSLGWVYYYRETYIVISAQPLFLCLVSVGSLTMAASILPMGFEEPVVNDQDALSKACMSVPWLYVLGATFTLSALFTKIRGVHEAYINPDIEIIEVSNIGFLKVLGSLLLVNLIILICWTTIAPLEWARVFGVKTDSFDRIVDTYGRCQGYDAEVFLVLLAVVNLSVLVVCCWRAYKSRNIETEFGESFYINVSVAAALQAWSIGIPILMVAFGNPTAKFFVFTGIVFVTSQSVVSLVYIPKVIALYHHLTAETSKIKLSIYHSYIQNSKPFNNPKIPQVGGNLTSSNIRPTVISEDLHSVSYAPEVRYFDEPAQEPMSAPTNLEDMSAPKGVTGGTKIIHNPRTEENLQMSGGYEFSRRQLELLQQINAADESGDANGKEWEVPTNYHPGAMGSSNGILRQSASRGGGPDVMIILEDEKEEEESPSPKGSTGNIRNYGV